MFCYLKPLKYDDLKKNRCMIMLSDKSLNLR